MIRARTPFSRAAGKSDVLYIGSATNQNGLRGRLQQYFSPGPTQRTNQRLMERCGDSDYDIGFVVTGSSSDALGLEAQLLQSYVDEHHELPPENRVLPVAPSVSRGPKASLPSTSVDARATAALMFDTVRDAPMSRATRQQLEGLRDRGDCDGIMRFISRCIAQRPAVGQSIERAGKVSFESRFPLVQQIYESRPGGRVENGIENLKVAFAQSFGVTPRPFGGPTSSSVGVSDNANGVQWNATVNRSDGTARLGVNLEGMEYDGWPMARLIERELAEPMLPGMASAAADDVAVSLMRDAWQASARLPIRERHIKGSPVRLAALTNRQWEKMLREAYECLEPERNHRGRAKQVVTLPSGQVEKQVSPHLIITTPLMTLSSVAAAEGALGDARRTLQPLYDFVRDRSMATSKGESALASSPPNTVAVPRLVKVDRIPPISVDELGALRRQLSALLSEVEGHRAAQTEGIRTRITRLSRDGLIPRHVAPLMITITEMRNSAEYEGRILSASESAVVRNAWAAIEDWARGRRR